MLCVTDVYLRDTFFFFNFARECELSGCLLSLLCDTHQMRITEIFPALGKSDSHMSTTVINIILWH